MSVVPLDSVMFDPLTWIHPSRFALPASLDGIAQRSIVNDMLISLYGLSLERPALPTHSLPRQFVEAWHLLPQIALLMACQRHRASLAKGGYGASLPDWLRQFAALSLVSSRSSPGETIPPPAQLLAWGKYELLAFAGSLPRGLRQRLDLLFPPEEGRDDLSRLSLPPPCRLLLKLAFQHAKRHPATPDTADLRRYIDQT
ncbi:Oxygen-regulated invasion protein OrgA [Sodalis glossinidius str. 'morsitans']|nr:type III secretion apparatus protein OrgA/MxiK [Sodalis glossinidius]AAS66873.1 OrgA [Sodalis glossinidius]CRL46375.1 Oxygen-regulated invasion protein OrgA [Sodalis glossinidius str. 'morsitans']